MGFTTLCFIRKNNEKLRASLYKLGYYEINVSEKDDVYKNLRTGTDLMGRICRYMQWRSEKYNSCIDCGENEDLFLAIAALRDDSDVYQWFVMDIEIYLNIHVGDWFIATDRIGGKDVGTQIEPLYCHKATVAELIEHF